MSSNLIDCIGVDSSGYKFRTLATKEELEQGQLISSSSYVFVDEESADQFILKLKEEMALDKCDLIIKSLENILETLKG